MSLLVGNLAFSDARAFEDQAKLGVLAASLASAVVGLVLLRMSSPVQAKAAEPADVPVVLDVLRFAQGYDVRAVTTGGSLAGRTLADVDVRRRFGVTVIGRWQGNDVKGARKLEPLTAEEPISPGDILLVAGADEAIETFSRFAEALPSDPPAPPLEPSESQAT
jgi:hypothetical protein